MILSYLRQAPYRFVCYSLTVDRKEVKTMPKGPEIEFNRREGPISYRTPPKRTLEGVGMYHIGSDLVADTNGAAEQIKDRKPGEKKAGDQVLQPPFSGDQVPGQVSGLGNEKTSRPKRPKMEPGA